MSRSNSGDSDNSYNLARDHRTLCISGGDQSPRRYRINKRKHRRNTPANLIMFVREVERHSESSRMDFTWAIDQVTIINVRLIIEHW